MSLALWVQLVSALALSASAQVPATVAITGVVQDQTGAVLPAATVVLVNAAGAAVQTAPCQEATGMAFDADTHRLFLGCDNKLMVMMDSTSGNVVSSVPVGAGVDSTWFDPQTKLAFTSNGGAGTVSVAHEDSASALKIGTFRVLTYQMK